MGETLGRKNLRPGNIKFTLCRVDLNGPIDIPQGLFISLGGQSFSGHRPASPGKNQIEIRDGSRIAGGRKHFQGLFAGIKKVARMQKTGEAQDLAFVTSQIQALNSNKVRTLRGPGASFGVEGAFPGNKKPLNHSTGNDGPYRSGTRSPFPRHHKNRKNEGQKEITLQVGLNPDSHQFTPFTFSYTSREMSTGICPCFSP